MKYLNEKLRYLTKKTIMEKHALGTCADKVTWGALVAQQYPQFVEIIHSLGVPALVFGFGNGGTGALQSPIVAELFGIKSHGLIFGVCGIGFTIGSAMGPLISGYLFDVTHSYQMAFLVSALVGIIGIGRNG